MAKRSGMAAHATRFGLLLIGVLTVGVVAAAGRPGTCASGPPCIPNVKDYGYFETNWRQWPDQLRPAQKYPRAVGSEVVPTPPGQEEVPPPKAMPLPTKPPAAKEENVPEIILPFGPPSKQSQPSPEVKPQVPGGISVPFPVETPTPEAVKPRSMPVEPVLPKVGGKAVESPQGPASKAATPPSKAEEKPAEPKAPSARDPLLEGGLPGISSPDRFVPALRPTLPIPVEKAPAEKDLIPAEPRKEPSIKSPIFGPGTINKTSASMPGSPIEDFPGDRSAASGGASGRPLRTNWTGALYPEHLTGGSLRYAGHEEEGEGNVKQAPPVAVAGYCPVQLCEHERWAEGDPRYAVVYQGRTYLLSGAAERQRFQASPERYVPTYGGQDPVLTVEEARAVPGSVGHSAIYRGRLYLFSNAITLAEFRQEPDRYAERAR